MKKKYIQPKKNHHANETTMNKINQERNSMWKFQCESLYSVLQVHVVVVVITERLMCLSKWFFGSFLSCFSVVVAAVAVISSGLISVALITFNETCTNNCLRVCVREWLFLLLHTILFRTQYIRCSGLHCECTRNVYCILW